MALKKLTVMVEERYINILGLLPNKSRVVNNLLALLFSDVDENDLMKIAYATSNSETLRKELKSILQRNMEVDISAQTDKSKTNKANKQISKELKEKEPTVKKSISFDSWWQ